MALGILFICCPPERVPGTVHCSSSLLNMAQHATERATADLTTHKLDVGTKTGRRHFLFLFLSVCLSDKSQSSGQTEITRSSPATFSCYQDEESHPDLDLLVELLTEWLEESLVQLLDMIEVKAFYTISSPRYIAAGANLTLRFRVWPSFPVLAAQIFTIIWLFYLFSGWCTH